jgi:hypothetical protein
LSDNIHILTEYLPNVYSSGLTLLVVTARSGVKICAWERAAFEVGTVVVFLISQINVWIELEIRPSSLPSIISN